MVDEEERRLRRRKKNLINNLKNKQSIDFFVLKFFLRNADMFPFGYISKKKQRCQSHLSIYRSAYKIKIHSNCILCLLGNKQLYQL